MAMVINLQPILENALVIVRPLKEEYFEDLFAAAKDPLIWEQHQNNDRHTLENFTGFFNESISSKGALVIAHAETNKIIGSSRFKIIDETDKIVEIGWSFLKRNYWGGAYNRTFKKLMINYALQYCTYVIFYVNPKNHRSQKAMEKLGATRMIYPEKPWVLREDIGVTYAVDSPLKD